MSRRTYALCLLAAAVTLALPGVSGCTAETWCTAGEIRAQAEAMGGRWQQTYQAHGCTITVDCAVIVPDTERMPVLEIERLKPSKERFDEVLAVGEMIRPQNPKFLLVPEGGDTLEGTGMSAAQTIRFATNGAGLTADWARCQDVWIQQGVYDMSGQGAPMPDYVIEETRAYAWERPLDVPLAGGNAHTVEDCTAFMRRWMEEFYPNEAIEIQPYLVSAFSPRSVRTDERVADAGEAQICEGYYVIAYEQQLNGVPLFRTIADYELTHITPDTPQKLAAENQLEAELRTMIQGARDASNRELQLRFRNENWHYTFLQFARICQEKHADVPLAPLSEVIAALEAEIAAGRIRDVTALRLGYVIYPGPQETGGAWAVPYWLADCVYLESAQAEVRQKKQEGNSVFHQEAFASIPVNAQTAQVIAFSVPSAEIYTPPQILTWEQIGK